MTSQYWHLYLFEFHFTFDAVANNLRKQGFLFLFVLIIWTEINSKLQPIIGGNQGRSLSILFTLYSRERINNPVCLLFCTCTHLTFFIHRVQGPLHKMLPFISIWMFSDQSEIKMSPP